MYIYLQGSALGFIWEKVLFTETIIEPAHEFVVHLLIHTCDIFLDSNRELWVYRYGDWVSNREIFSRQKVFNLLSKIVICSTVDHCKMFYLPAYC